MSTSTALEFGVINTLRTGNAVYDLMVCIVVPAVVQRITNSGQDALGILRTVFEFLCCLFFPRKYVTHLVETKEVLGANRTYRLDDDSKGNELLQKAILLYLTEHVDLQDKSGRYDLLERPNAKKILEENEPTSSYRHGRRSKLSAPYHKRYALGNDKTFDNVFFEEKESLLQLLDHFENKTEKFAIEGFPNKVGLLLYGPPGTGKTSVIKAVAEKTGRHIVNISLGKVTTNQELMDAMLDLRYAVDGLDLPVLMGFKDVVFVMEDIDCASSVVASREEGSSTQMSDKSAEGVDSTPVFATVDTQETSAVDDDAGFDDAPRVGQFYRRGKKAARFFGPSMMNFDDDHDDGLLSALLQSQIEFEGFGPKMKGGFVSSSNSTDKLNLAGVLNVLDGVIDCPGRIVIMTTNHPEVLDPALVRPGRISKKLHLGYMSIVQIEKMISYYFARTLNDGQRRRLQK
ncbi:hypothetical protein JG688_00017637 [Phytophthora aleatoria]|uniref:AAA+ ATPase domain-containing protein n=1 Tax=Phytophthora aleatoria TaxID=2496075 RepID=A0A8J5LYE7_9STRA|nr:hypothetical protein JG688_00017637 [Phytophthora aleatoria]